MADNTVSTQFTADATQAKVGANEAAQAVEKSAKKQEDSLSKIGKAASLVQGVFSKIIIPAAIARAIVGIATAFTDAANRADEFRAKVQGAIRSISGADTGDPFGLLKFDLDSALKEFEAKTSRELNAALDIIEKKRDELRQRSVGAKVKDYLVGAETETELDKAVSDALAAFGQKLATGRAKLKRDAETAAQRDADDALQQEQESDQRAADESERRAKDANRRAAAIDREGLDERAKAQADFDAKVQDLQEQFSAAPSQSERDAIRSLYESEWRALQRTLTKISQDGEAERLESTRRYVQAQIDLYRELEDAIQSASQAQQQASQSLTTGFGSDIRAIRQLLEVRGGWKK